MHWLWALLVFLSLLAAMPAQTCYGCQKPFSNLPAHLDKCKKAHNFFDGRLRRRVEDRRAKVKLHEAFKQKKVEAKRAKAAEVKERLEARRVQLEVEREASMPVMVEPAAPDRRQHRVPGRFHDMLPTSLKGLPHLRLKPNVALPADRPSKHPLASTSTLGIQPRPRVTVEDAPDDPMCDVRPLCPPSVPAPPVQAGPVDFEHTNIDACSLGLESIDFTYTVQGPEAAGPSRPILPIPPPPPPPSLLPPPPPQSRMYIDTQPNRFGVFRRYTARPRSDPEEGLTLDAFADAGTHLRPPSDPRERDPLRPFRSTARKWLANAGDVAANSFAPFLKWSSFKLMEWQYSGSMTKSTAELQRLVDTVILDDRFKKEELVGFCVEHEQCRLDELANTGSAFSADDGWRESTVWLDLPHRGDGHKDAQSAPGYLVKGIWTRSFIEVIKTAFRDPTARKFHWFPHLLLRKRSTPDAPPERLVTDIYNSDAMLHAHEQIQQLPPNPDDPPNVERVVAAIGVYSDSTRLANFGTASLWPIYAFVLNLSKYLHLKPTMFAAHHLAYIPSLPAGLFKTYKNSYGEPPTEAVIRFLKQELVQKIWLLLLDPEFMTAYEHYD